MNSCGLSKCLCDQESETLKKNWSTKIKFPLSKEFSRNLGSIPKTSTVLSNSRKHRIGFLMKQLGECGGSTVITAACYWLSRNYIPVSCSEICVRVGGVKSQPFSVGVGLRQGCVLSPFFLDRQSKPSGQGCHYWKLQDQLFTFADDLLLGVLNIQSAGFQRYAIKLECGDSVETFTLGDFKDTPTSIWQSCHRQTIGNWRIAWKIYECSLTKKVQY